MRYREHDPSARLAPLVDCIWTLEGHARDLEGAPQAVLPDGRPELILHFGDPFDRIDGSRGERQPARIFAGQLHRRLILHPAGHIAVLGVRFHPHGAAAFMRQSQHEFADRTLSLDLADSTLASIARDVHESAQTLCDAVQAIDTALARLAADVAFDARIAAAVHTIQRTAGLIPIEHLAHGLNVTRRQLERLFLSSVGVSPKRLARLTRFQRAVRMLECDVSAPGVHAAHACGYADQAHFIRDFQDLAGCAPGAHLLARAELTALFSGASVRYARALRSASLDEDGDE